MYKGFLTLFFGNEVFSRETAYVDMACQKWLFYSFMCTVNLWAAGEVAVP